MAITAADRISGRTVRRWVGERPGAFRGASLGVAFTIRCGMTIFRTLLSFLACALLIDAVAAQDVALITRDGVKQILANPGTGPVGAFKPDVVVVEYFDYNCPYCKKQVPTLKALLAQDPTIGIVYKDWPILGPVSQYAAASALAAGWQGK